MGNKICVTFDEENVKIMAPAGSSSDDGMCLEPFPKSLPVKTIKHLDLEDSRQTKVVNFMMKIEDLKRP